MALRSEAFPDLVFLTPEGGETRLQLSSTNSRVRAVAGSLRARFASGAVIALMLPTGPDLVIDWLGCLLAGLQPLVLQYPTKKTSADYLQGSIRNSVSLAGIGAIIVDDVSKPFAVASSSATIEHRDLAVLPDASGEPYEITEYSILQLSSGTTGHRKAIRFTGEALHRHVHDCNETLALTKADRIASWLPLYHDMGYIACFVMPLMLGVEVVMMDPMTWVRRPELLFEAIERHDCSVCYMPNFGFEVMSRCPPRPLAGMRWWISCSEPVSAVTARNFIAGFAVDPESFAPCYAMAENVFAISLRRGLRTERLDMADVVSCGRPIAGVEIRSVDGEIWVRSPTSLDAYIGGESIRDADGFYPTGDLGTIIDGELYVSGRKQDLLIQAGRKFLLSDIDIALNQIHPEARGRAAAVIVRSEELGTEQPVVLIEAPDFFSRTDRTEIGERVQAVTDLDQLDIRFVPPRFLTKTSSGKINRAKTAADWIAVQNAQRTARRDAWDAVSELETGFPGARWDVPVEETLDSLSLTLLGITLSGTSVAYDGRRTLSSLMEELRAAQMQTPVPHQDRVIQIVSLADVTLIDQLTEAHLARLGEEVGCRVTIEHVCLPPSAIVLSDLIFTDYFQPRVEDPQPYAMVGTMLDKLRAASLIITDDVAEAYFPPAQVYGVLSHQLQRDPRADCLAVRWQRYPRNHDQLPLTVVSGIDLPVENCTKTTELIGRYLDKPVFRVARIGALASITEGWEYRPLFERIEDQVAPDDLVRQLAAFIRSAGHGVKQQPAGGGRPLQRDDLPHYCAHFVDEALMTRVLDRFESFYIAGQKSTLPFVQKRLAELGKRFVMIPSYAPEVVRGIAEPCECLLICGAMGPYEVTGPAASFMFSSHPWRVQDMPDLGLEDAVWNTPPPSGDDWFHPFKTAVRSKNWQTFRRARGIDASP